MIATSLPASSRSGMQCTVPLRPVRTMRSMAGVPAASRGVRPPSSRIGRSAAPSTMTRPIFASELFRVLIHDLYACGGSLDHRKPVYRRERVPKYSFLSLVGGDHDRNA